VSFVPVSFKNLSPGVIASTPVRSIANTVKKEGPVLANNVAKTTAKYADDFVCLTKTTFNAQNAKTASTALKNAGQAFKKFIQCF